MYKHEFSYGETTIGEPSVDGFYAACTVKTFDDGTFCRIGYMDRKFAIVGESEDSLDKIILAEMEHFPPYQIGVHYKVGDIIEFNGILYEVIQEHTSQEDWRPDMLPALYMEARLPGRITLWQQPGGSHDAYRLDELVYHNGEVWKCVEDYNVWEPGVYGWDATKADLVELYSLEEDDQLEHGGLEFEVILTEAPENSEIRFTLHSRNLNFYKQPEEDLPEDVDERIINSIAVYHRTKGGTCFSKVQAAKYKSGKAFHILRPKIIDANDNWVWGDLNLEDEELIVSVDEEFLQNATYPVRVDPTIGYTSVGGTTVATLPRGYKTSGSWELLPEEAEFEIVSGSFYGYGHNGDAPARVALYEGLEGGTRNLIAYSAEFIIPDSGSIFGWRDFTGTGDSNSVFTGHSNVWVSSISINYNAVTRRDFNGFRCGNVGDIGGEGTIPPATCPQPSLSDAIYSIYVVYEASGDPVAYTLEPVVYNFKKTFIRGAFVHFDAGWENPQAWFEIKELGQGWEDSFQTTPIEITEMNLGTFEEELFTKLDTIYEYRFCVDIGTEILTGETESFTSPAERKIDVNLTDIPSESRWGFARLTQTVLHNELDEEAIAEFPGRGENVIFYMIDTGIRSTHIEFEGTYLSGKDFYAFDSINNPFSDPGANPGHGTACASLVAGNTVGLAPDAQLAICRVRRDTGEYVSIRAFLAATSWIMQVHPKNRFGVIPLSIPISMKNTRVHQEVEDRIRELVDAGFFICTAAANDGMNVDDVIHSVVGMTEIMSIGVLNNEGNMPTYSNYGENVDFYVPGHPMLSARNIGDSSYTTFTGTSAASALFGGVIGCILSGYPGFTPATLRQYLIDTATTDVVGNLPAGSNSNNRVPYIGLKTANLPTIGTPTLVRVEPKSKE